MPNKIEVNDYKQYDTTTVTQFEEGAFILLLHSQPTQAITGILQMMQNSNLANRKLYVVTPDASKRALKLDAYIRATSIRVLSDYGKVGIVRGGKVRLCDTSDLYDLLSVRFEEDEAGIE